MMYWLYLNEIRERGLWSMPYAECGWLAGDCDWMYQYYKHPDIFGIQYWIKMVYFHYY